MPDTFEEMLEELNAAALQRKDPEIVQIRIYPNALKGSMVVVPLIGQEAERHRLHGIERPQELLIHPDDWRRIKQALPRRDLSVDARDGRLGEIVGIPVIGA